MDESLVGQKPSKENVAELIAKVHTDIRGDIWSGIFVMIYMTTFAISISKGQNASRQA